MPEALIVGVRPSQTRLDLSRGALDALGSEELEAVVAHELAHAANRDAMVIPIVSIPHVLSETLLSTILPEISMDTEKSRRQNARFRSSAVGSLLFYAVETILAAFEPAIRGGWVLVAVVSRSREVAADRTAVAVTGSPASLASALRTLDDELDSATDADLREVSTHASLSILPIDRTPSNAVTFGSSAGRTSLYHQLVRKPLYRTGRATVRIHPLTTDRLERLTKLERVRN